MMTNDSKSGLPVIAHAVLKMTLALAVHLFTGTARGDAPASVTGTAGTVDDAFVVSGLNSNANPDWCYGGAGALVVAGANTSNGEYQAVLKFDLQAIKSGFDSTYGVGNWSIESISLILKSNVPFQGQQPNNPIFPRINAGGFAVDWMVNDNWSEGPSTANPNTPYMPVDAPLDGVTFHSLPSLLSASDETIGAFHWDAPSGTVISYPVSMEGSGGQVSTTWSLALQPGFLADVESGGLVSLRFYATDASTAYLFNSKTKGPDYWPILEVLAVPEPSTVVLTAAGIGLLALLKRRKRSIPHQAS